MSSGPAMRALALRGSDIVVDPPNPLDALKALDGQIVWIDLSDPTQESISPIASTLGLHPLAVEDALQRRQRPKVEEYDKTFFITTHAARPVDHGSHDVSLDEIDIFFGKGFLITAHQGTCPAIDEARRRLTQAPPDLRVTDGYVLYVVLDVIVDSYFPVLDALDDYIEGVEDTLFTVHTPQTMDRLFEAKRALLLLRRVAAPQRDMMNIFMRHETPLISTRLGAYFRDIYDHLLRITDQIDTHRDLLAGALDIYLSITSNRLNEVVKFLTVITSIFALLAVVTGFYGMNFEHTFPSFKSPHGVPMVIGIMGIGILIMLALFRHRRWL
jgi:magnesium transporter